MKEELMIKGYACGYYTMNSVEKDYIAKSNVAEAIKKLELTPNKRYTLTFYHREDESKTLFSTGTLHTHVVLREYEVVRDNELHKCKVHHTISLILSVILSIIVTIGVCYVCR